MVKAPFLANGRSGLTSFDLPLHPWRFVLKDGPGCWLCFCFVAWRAVAQIAPLSVYDKHGFSRLSLCSFADLFARFAPGGGGVVESFAWQNVLDSVLKCAGTCPSSTIPQRMRGPQSLRLGGALCVP